MSILLVFPPVSRGDVPPLGVALLLAHLRKHGIPVTAVDGCRALLDELGTRERVERGLDHAARRLDEMHGSDRLGFMDAYEYWHIALALKREAKIAAKIGPIGRRIDNLPLIARQADAASRVQIASLAHYPELIDYEWRHIAPQCEFSSADILAYVQTDGMLSGFFERLLSRAAAASGPPRIIGLSILLQSQILPAFLCASVARKFFPTAHITMGGATVSSMFRTIPSTRLFELTDSFVLDEGEVPLERLWRELGSEHPRLDEVPGLVWLDDGVVRYNTPAPVRGIEESEPPDFAFHCAGGEADALEMRTPFRLSKGCNWGRCAFCSTDLPVVRHCQHGSADFLFEQLRHFVTEKGLRRFRFVDESPDPEILEALCRRLASEGLDIDFSCHMRFNPRITLDRCMVYRQGGCTRFYMGLEHWSDRILKLMNKGITAGIAEQVLLNMNWAGLRSVVYMMVGFPGETEEEAQESYAKIVDKAGDGHVGAFMYSMFTLLPGSDVWRRPERYGVTDIRVPAGQDLNPPTRHFSCPGISPTRAAQLSFEFNRTLAVDGLRKASKDTTPIVLGERACTIRYDVEDLMHYLEPVFSVTVSHAEQMQLGREEMGDYTPVRL